MKKIYFVLIVVLFSSLLWAQTSSMTLQGTGTAATSAHMIVTENGGNYAYYCVNTETVESGASKTLWDPGAYCGGGTSTASVEMEEALSHDLNKQDSDDLGGIAMLPETFGISQNYPNPFNPITTIRYQLPEASHVVLTVYDIMGRQVVQLINATQAPGYKSVQWNSKDQFGQSVSAGMYLYHIQAGSFNKTIKMVLLK